MSGGLYAPLDGFGRDSDPDGAAQLDQVRRVAAGVLHGEAHRDVHAARLRPHAVRDQNLRQETDVLSAVVICETTVCS